MDETIILFLFIVILFVVVIVVFIYFMRNKESEIRNSCLVDKESLIQISTLPCCLIADQKTPYKYIPQYNLVASPNSRYWLNVCADFCSNGKTKMINGEVYCEDGTRDDDLKRCIELTKPESGCNISSQPVAINGEEYYYAYFASEEICKQTTSC